MALAPNRILIHYGEIALKGRNRGDFEGTLRENIKHRLRREKLRWRVTRHHDRLHVDVPEAEADQIERALIALSKITGISWLAPARWLPSVRGDSGLTTIESETLALAEAHFKKDGAFAVRVRRGHKGFPMRSSELERHLGALIIERTDWSRVNLTTPDRTFHVDLYPAGTYCYADKRQGVAGLPVNTGGQVLALLSGGIDSPVAAYLMARRGCRVDVLHMTASHVQQRNPLDNPVVGLARQLSRFTQRTRLFMLPYTHFDLALAGQRTGYEMILFRRFMVQLSETMAHRIGALALVTGDSLGQVASQTLENLVAHTQATEMPILRPLIAFDKEEIIQVARKIETYEISIQPYKDCCALLSQNPKTKSTHEQLTELENRLLPDRAGLIERTIDDGIEMIFDCGEEIIPAAG